MDTTLSTSIPTSALEGLVSLPREPEATERTNLGQKEFFELMVAQLTHQDPIHPLTNNEFLSQVAQFNTVSGIQEMQDSVHELASSLQASMAAQAATLVGRKVLVPSEVATLPAGGGLAGAVELPESTSQLVVRISDPAGRLIKELELGPQGPGLVSFSWDGLGDDGRAAPPGSYVVHVQASLPESGEKPVSFAVGRVTSATLAAGAGTTLQVDGLGQFELQQIRAFV